MAEKLKEYNGVVFTGPERVSEVIRARNLEAAKTQMKKKHGPEKDAKTNSTRWVCGLAPQSLTGHAVHV